MPEELVVVLESAPEATQIFEKLSAGKQRAIIHIVSSYKNEQTWIDKALLITQNIKNGIHDYRDFLNKY